MKIELFRNNIEILDYKLSSLLEYLLEFEGEINSSPIFVLIETSDYIKMSHIDKMIGEIDRCYTRLFPIIDFDDVPYEYKQFNKLKK